MSGGEEEEQVGLAAVDAVRPAADAKSIRLELALDTSVRTITGDADPIASISH